MKTNSIFFILFLTLAISACNKDRQNKKDLVGTWQIESFSGLTTKYDISDFSFDTLFYNRTFKVGALSLDVENDGYINYQDTTGEITNKYITSWKNIGNRIELRIKDQNFFFNDETPTPFQFDQTDKNNLSLNYSDSRLVYAADDTFRLTYNYVVSLKKRY